VKQERTKKRHEPTKMFLQGVVYIH